MCIVFMVIFLSTEYATHIFYIKDHPLIASFIIPLSCFLLWKSFSFYYSYIKNFSIYTPIIYHTTIPFISIIFSLIVTQYIREYIKVSHLPMGYSAVFSLYTIIFLAFIFLFIIVSGRLSSYRWSLSLGSIIQTLSMILSTIILLSTVWLSNTYNHIAIILIPHICLSLLTGMIIGIISQSKKYSEVGMKEVSGFLYRCMTPILIVSIFVSLLAYPYNSLVYIHSSLLRKTVDVLSQQEILYILPCSLILSFIIVYIMTLVVSSHTKEHTIRTFALLHIALFSTIFIPLGVITYINPVPIPPPTQKYIPQNDDAYLYHIH